MNAAISLVFALAGRLADMGKPVPEAAWRVWELCFWEISVIRKIKQTSLLRRSKIVPVSSNTSLGLDLARNRKVSGLSFFYLLICRGLA
ncbi:hypothetical protein [Undibacterium sp.]|jgi:hypothetical protein|uniref:hypothetical protein n=1 Tax=Undibacterium sp. TaxID=1914977 RepID=UPI002CA2B49D|nr:hypothetical protein [Undibacterium sp.]HTD05550.1 hypothetical protein [Undibacterium sp.]